MNANFMRILSPEEVTQSQKKVDSFLLSLDYNTKYRIRDMLEPLLQQANCEHEWIDPNTYVNELDKSEEFCRHCHLTRPIDPLAITPKNEDVVLEWMESQAKVINQIADKVDEHDIDVPRESTKDFIARYAKYHAVKE
jgi:hypothetical protein